MSTIYTSLSLLLTRFLLLFLFVISTLPAAAQLKVMTLGNSITQGNNEHPSYRYRLWKKLVDAEIDVEFVGSHDVNRDGVSPSVKGEVYKTQIYSNRNEGHWGWRTDEILNGRQGEPNKRKLSQWLNMYTPDVVLLHLGSNDVMQEQPVQETITEVEYVVLEIRKTNPNVTVLLAQLIPMNYNNVGPNTINRLNEFNAQIPLLAERLNTEQSPVIVVDQNTGFDPTPGVDTWDGIHPNTSGEEKMAQRWFEALDPVITPLPVELSAFGARTNTQGQVLLEWQTASEVNNAYFEVQRSQTGKEFEAIGQVKGSGTTVVAQNYTFTDSAAMSGTLYYRLKQVDTDGTSSFSKVAHVQVEEREQALQVFPTSSRGQNITLHLQHHEHTEEADIHIYTSEGKLVHSMENVRGNNGAFRTPILTHQLHGAGLYLVRVAAGNKVYQTEFVVEQ